MICIFKSIFKYSNILTRELAAINSNFKYSNILTREIQPFQSVKLQGVPSAELSSGNFTIPVKLQAHSISGVVLNTFKVLVF